MDRASQISDKARLADLLVVLALAALVALYLFDAVRASTHIYNLILVLPLAVVVLVLCSVAFVQSLRGAGNAQARAEPVAAAAPVIGTFAGFVLLLPWLGFDVATCLFVAVFLWLHGERRWPWLLGYPIAFAFVLCEFFARMLAFPMPLLILGPAS